jgi:hypothetical protein
LAYTRINKTATHACKLCF